MTTILLRLLELRLFIFSILTWFAFLGSLLAYAIIKLLLRWANSWWLGAQRGLLQCLSVICQAGGRSRREQKLVCLQPNWEVNVLVVFLSLCLSPCWTGRVLCWPVVHRIILASTHPPALPASPVGILIGILQRAPVHVSELLTKALTKEFFFYSLFKVEPLLAVCFDLFRFHVATHKLCTKFSSNTWWGCRKKSPLPCWEMQEFLFGQHISCICMFPKAM